MTTKSEYSLHPLAVPEFVSGMFYGLVGDLNLEAIETCWGGGVEIIKDAEQALADILRFDIEAAG